MAVTGDMAGLKALADKFQRLTSAGFTRQLAQGLAVSAWQQTLAGFAESRDPYGNPWETLKSRSGKPLIDTGQMRQSVSAEATSNGFRLRIGTKSAAVHQYGATIVPKRARALRFEAGGKVVYAKRVVIPRRQMIPMQSTGGLGPIWTAAFNQVADAILRKNLGRAA